jgi:hypothetical protein
VVSGVSKAELAVSIFREKSVIAYETTWCHSPKDHYLKTFSWRLLSCYGVDIVTKRQQPIRHFGKWFVPKPSGANLSHMQDYASTRSLYVHPSHASAPREWARRRTCKKSQIKQIHRRIKWPHTCQCLVYPFNEKTNTGQNSLNWKTRITVLLPRRRRWAGNLPDLRCSQWWRLML